MEIYQNINNASKNMPEIFFSAINFGVFSRFFFLILSKYSSNGGENYH